MEAYSTAVKPMEDKPLADITNLHTTQSMKTYEDNFKDFSEFPFINTGRENLRAKLKVCQTTFVDQNNYVTSGMFEKPLRQAFKQFQLKVKGKEFEGVSCGSQKDDFIKLATTEITEAYAEGLNIKGFTLNKELILKVSRVRMSKEDFVELCHHTWGEHLWLWITKLFGGI